MKAKIIIYSLTVLSLAAAVYFLIVKKQAPTGLSTGGVKAYSIVKKYTYEGAASSLLANQKGFVFASKTTDRILITHTDLEGKKIFTAREPIVNRDAVINDLNMATDSSGARLCVAWTELLNENTRLYYKFHDIESGNPAEVVEIKETNPISYLNIFYNAIYDEFDIFYIAKNIPKLVAIDSLGFNKPPVSLSFKITPDIIKIIWNEYDSLYALVTPKRLIQFDNNGNLISDNSFVIGNIAKPNNISIYYNQINNVYNIFVSQKDILHLVTMDNQANILNTGHGKLPDTSNGDFAATDNGQAYDIFYISEIMNKIIHTTVSYEGGFSNKYYKLTDAEGTNPSVILSNGKLGILYTTLGGSPESVLCIAVQGGWGAGKKSDIAPFGGRYGPPAVIDGGGGTGKRKIVPHGGRPVNVVSQTWEELPSVITGPDYKPVICTFTDTQTVRIVDIMDFAIQVFPYRNTASGVYLSIWLIKEGVLRGRENTIIPTTLLDKGRNLTFRRPDAEIKITLLSIEYKPGGAITKIEVRPLMIRKGNAIWREGIGLQYISPSKQKTKARKRRSKTGSGARR